MQKVLIGYLQLLGMEQPEMLAVLLTLKTDEEVEEMNWYLHDNLVRLQKEDWNTVAQSQIMDKMQEIYDRTQQSKPDMTEAVNHE